jgi:uncharacterized membrane protein YfcA
VDLSTVDHVLAAGAALLAGSVNAIAGGGTLITFPTLVAVGVPAVASNITSTVALCPGYTGGTWAQREDLAHQRARLVPVAAVAVVGGLIGSWLLVVSPEKLFRQLVPFLILGACAIFAGQDRIRAKLPPRDPNAPVLRPGVGTLVACGVAATYGGYFGAGLGIISLAILGVALPDRLVHVNALKQWLAFCCNVVAAAFFAASGRVVWTIVLVMAPASLLGGALGGRLARSLDPRIVRWTVIVLGILVAARFWV